jgi:hypothetical protein
MSFDMSGYIPLARAASRETVPWHAYFRSGRAPWHAPALRSSPWSSLFSAFHEHSRVSVRDQNAHGFCVSHEEPPGIFKPLRLLLSQRHAKSSPAEYPLALSLLHQA